MKKIKFDYKWVIVALSFLMVFIALGFCSSNRSLYLAPITEALGIKRSAYALNDSFRFVTTSVVNLFFGTLISRFGTKKLIGAGFVSLILSMLLYACATNVFTFYIGSILLGVGMSWTSTTMVGCVINKWCREKKGTIMGAVLAANGLGSALATQIVSPLIYEEGNAFGYRNAYWLIVVILLVVGALLMVFYKENPPEAETAPVQVTKKKARGQNWVGIEYSEAVKKSWFYLAAICIFLTGFVLQGISGVSSAHMKDVGLDPGYIATVLSMHSLALAAFKFLTGVLYDRFGLRVTMTICDMAAMIAILSLALLTNSQTGLVLAMVYSIISALALPLETVMLPIFAGDLFGQKSYNKILGIFVSINTAGYACGAPVMNWVFDTYGSYRLIFWICCAVMFAVIVAFQFVVTVSGHCRNKIMIASADL